MLSRATTRGVWKTLCAAPVESKRSHGGTNIEKQIWVEDSLAKKARLARVQQNSALNLSSVEEMERALVSLMLAVGLSRTRELMRELVYELQGDTALLSTIFRSDDE